MADESEEVMEELDEQPDVKEYFGILDMLVESTGNKEYDALMLDAPPGLGKTYQIQTQLNDTIGKNNYHTVSGYKSPLKLYETLWNHQEEVIFFDDVAGLLEDDRALQLLKGAMWAEEDGKRMVGWSSTTDKLDDNIPGEFEFKGSIIISANETPDNDDVEAVKSRCKHYELTFTLHERCEIIKEIAKAPRDDLDYDERMEVANWIVDNAYEGMEVDLRDLIHCFDFYREHESMWKEMAMEILDFSDEYSLLKDLYEKYDHAGDAIEEYKEVTGNSRSTFYNRKEHFGIEDFV